MTVDLDDLDRQAAAWRAALAEVTEPTAREAGALRRVEVALIAGVTAARIAQDAPRP